MATLVIVSTRPRAGKTAFASWLAWRMINEGVKVGITESYQKQETSTPAQGIRIFKSVLSGAVIADPIPRGATASEISQIAAELKTETTIVEGLTDDPKANRVLAEQLDASVMLVADINDPVIDHAMPYGDRLVGVVVNNLPRYKKHQLENELMPSLEANGIAYLGAIPEDRRLIAVTVRTMCEHLNGRFTGSEEHSEELVDYVLIGANIVDWGVHYFSSRPNTVVLVRGDRPDIQMAALATPIKGMLLTEGVEPLEYVHYEAEQEEIPVAVVDFGTHDAAAELETLHDRSGFDHPDKLTRFRELADDFVSLNLLRNALEKPVTG